MRRLGRILQIIGLILPVLAIVVQITPIRIQGHALLSQPGQMLMLLIAALCLFWIGRLVEGYTRR